MFLPRYLIRLKNRAGKFPFSLCEISLTNMSEISENKHQRTHSLENFYVFVLYNFTALHIVSARPVAQNPTNKRDKLLLLPVLL